MGKHNAPGTNRGATSEPRHARQDEQFVHEGELTVGRLTQRLQAERAATEQPTRDR